MSANTKLPKYLASIESTIDEIVNERLNERVAQELRALADSYSSPKLFSAPVYKALKKTQPDTKGRPKGAINNTVLASLTASPMSTKQITVRVQKVSPGVSSHQVGRSLSALFLKKRCTREGKMGHFRYSK